MLTRDQMENRLRELGEPIPASASAIEIHQTLVRALSERIVNGGGSELDEVLEHPQEIERGAALAVPPVEPRPQIPNAAIWAHLAMMAEPLARSSLVKPALRGKPNDVLMVLLTGYDLGITMTTALAKVHIIEGQPAASPELMLGLIRREGHRAWPGGRDKSGIEQESDDIRTLQAVVHAVRKDDPDQEITVTYSVGQAEQAGLCQVEGNKIRARSRQGNPLPWETYPEDLLWARAVSRLGRRSFSDVLLGLSYVPEELGYVDAQSYEPLAPAPPPEIEVMPGRLRELRDRIDALPDGVKRDLSGQWKKLIEAKALHPLDRLLEREYEAASDLIANYETKAQTAGKVVAGAAADSVDTLPPCEADADEQASLDLGRETGLPFACLDFDQKDEPRTCVTPPQCAEAGACLRSPI